MRTELLTVDGIVNLALGILLVWYPTFLPRVLGLADDGRPFFASILGAVLFGVGIALIIERYSPPLRMAGLGLGGAIAINLCGGVVLAAWLVTGALAPTPFGQFGLWALVFLLVGLSTVELYSQVRHAEE